MGCSARLSQLTLPLHLPGDEDVSSTGLRVGQQECSKWLIQYWENTGIAWWSDAAQHFWSQLIILCFLNAHYLWDVVFMLRWAGTEWVCLAAGNWWANLGGSFTKQWLLPLVKTAWRAFRSKEPSTQWMGPRLWLHSENSSMSLGELGMVT